ncbi:MAG: alpha-2-macroglobulin [Bacteroidetes bacterium]|nr:alpha-2-macroglobulin [Bacteroidota bacterium]MBS1931145.1 alpha-2-macroglobulin [Bacteroidota bacterium]
MPTQPIKAFFLLSILSIFFSAALSQQPMKNYEKEWKKVDELTQKNLPKSALDQVKKIYSTAKKDKQDAQVIKSLLYITNLQSQTRENNNILSIKDFEKEILSANQPARSLLQSIVAEMYLGYFNSHRYQLYNRTNTATFQKDDIATWTADDLHKKIGELYLQSIKEEKLLEQTKLEPYDAIINKGNVRHLRPTLFDLLAHRALDYFKSDERDITRPAYAFEINNSSAFDPAADFIKLKFPTKDSASLQQKALLLFQKLIAFHLNDAKPDAFIDVDIERIEFVNQKGVQSNKKELYLGALNHIVHQYENNPAASEAWYLIAEQYNTDANEYKPFGDTTHKFDHIKAKEICERVLQQKDSSEGKVNSYNLLNQINQKDLKFSVEKINIPNQPFRSLIQYKNFSTLYLRIVKSDKDPISETENYYADKFWEKLIATTPLRSWQQSLPDTKDLQQHSAEIKVDGLPAGRYVLIASTEKDFDLKKGIIGARYFYVSNISFINNQKDYFVLNRETGQPLAGATIQSWESRYDYKTSKYISVKGNSFKTDDKGYFRFIGKNDKTTYSYDYRLDITYNNDRLFLNDASYDYYYSNNTVNTPKENTTVFLFTDRSIYRPGQTVFFKGIAVSKMSDETNSRISSGYNSKIYLRNANYQTIDSLDVTTNDYGSFSGKFQLPQSGLNGYFSLYMKDNIGSVNFSMEEYKRPKFFVDYEKIKGGYKVNDSVKITGIAKAYAGNNIDGAMVKYRVVRQPRLIYSWMFWRWWQPPVKEMEIAHGEIQTDKDGKFEIRFKAIPDLTVDKKFDPVFDYTIYADVTDINGETRSGQTSVTAGYQSLLLNIEIPSSLPADSLKSISIRTTNMSGEFEPSKVTVIISKLKQENRLIRNRFWDRPDQFVMTKEEYIKNFPHDEYDNETDYRSWEKEKKVIEKSDSTNENSKFKIQDSKFEPGYYKAEISTKDKDGNEVKDVKYIELYNEKSNQLTYSKYLWTEGSNPIEPGEKTSIQLGTSANDLFIIQQIDKQQGVRSLPTGQAGQESGVGNFNIVSLNNEKKSFDFTATESDRGGYGVNYLFVKDNRFYEFNDVISVPWTNKELKIEYATFRDKTLPGSVEKWKVKITGYKNEKVAAEMLASMYDASLDQFKPHEWNQPYLWPNYYSGQRWNGSINFNQLQSQQHQGDNPVYKYLRKEYDYLIFSNPNYSYGYSDVIRLRGISSISQPTMALEGKAAGLQEVVVTAYGDQRKKGTPGSAKEVLNRLPEVEADTVTFNVKESNNQQQGSETQIRKNFNETAFFFPDLHTDSTGAIEFSFIMPEALTKWKFMALAHTKDLAFGYSTKEMVTQKQLMVQPNAPRFLREGDRIEFSAKIANLTDKELTGTAELQLFDAATNEPVDGAFQNMYANQYFTVASGQSESVNFLLQVPYQFNKALTWRIVAKAGDFSDGEEASLPVLTNRMLVTETLPLNMRGAGTKHFKFEKLLTSGNSESLQNHALTIEYTSNPVWYAVQALPYLMEYPYECAEQTWNRYYANSLAGMIANSSPRIKQIFEKWRNIDTAALLSNLQKNEELKSVLLEETPWVLDAKSEEQQKKNIALLFDMVKMGNALNSAYEKLKQMQSNNDGFVWFKGGPDDRYITQYIVTGIGHLKKLNGYSKGQESKLKEILATAIPYLDKKIKEDYDDLKKYKTDLKKYVPGYIEVQYLYMRSFFPEYPVASASQKAYSYFRERAQKTWTQQNKYMEGMIALVLFRTGDSKTPADILKSLKETSINNEELGMYWKDISKGWFWYQAPIETQSLLIEAFQEMSKDTKTVGDLKTWLLKNKQTNNWQTTKATAEACYALLLQGSQWLTTERSVEIKLGSTEIVPTEAKQQEGTGYFKQIIDGQKIDTSMGNISVTIESPKEAIQNNLSSWGAVYWQYFEDLDKITPSATPLKLVKKLFVEKNTDKGPVLTPVNDGDELKVGDKIKVRIELRVDRDMEYVHMKDMRASCMEPVNVLSGYKWQGGLGYYESTKDASTNFFFNYLKKGTYVFEYPLFVTNKGNFSNGITSIQCMYAPEFSSHSEGIRVNVE